LQRLTETPQTVLLVSADEGLVLTVLALIKARAPLWQVQTYKTGQEGFEAVYQAPCSVVLVDSQLPDMPGAQLTRLLNHDPALKKVPILLIASETQQAQYERFREFLLLADAFIAPEALSEQLLQTMLSVMVLYRGLNADESHGLQLLHKHGAENTPISRLMRLLDQSITQEAITREFHKLFELVSNPHVLVHMLFRILSHALPYDVATVVFIDKSRDAKPMTFDSRDGISLSADEMATLSQQLTQTLLPHSSAPEQMTFHVEHLYETLSNASTETKPTPKLAYYSAFPFFADNQLVGALAFWNEKPLTYETLYPFRLFQQSLSGLMRVRRYYTEVQTRSYTDPLTGLYTHQHFLWLLEREMRLSKRHQASFCLAGISIEGIREMNVLGGHPLGDQSLVRVSKLVEETIRNTDLACRAGTRTLIMAFPSTSPDGTVEVLKRVQEKVDALLLSWQGQNVSVHCTWAVAELDAEVETPSAFLAKVQKVLDLGRESGDNTIHLCRPPQGEEA